MSRKLTITVSDEIYAGLQKAIGRGKTSRFFETLVRPYVLSKPSDDFQDLARRDTFEAQEWIEASVDEELPDDEDEEWRTRYAEWKLKHAQG